MLQAEKGMFGRQKNGFRIERKFITATIVGIISEHSFLFMSFLFLTV